MFNLEELAKIKYVFFDIDGVLSVPRYKCLETDKYVSGFSDEEWIKYDVLSEHPYKNCIAPKLMKTFVQRLYENPCFCERIFCLTADNNSFSYNSKKKFILENYSGIEENDIILVASADMKIDIIKYIAMRDKINLAECLIVEDTFQTIIDAELTGISNLHIAGVPDLLLNIEEDQRRTISIKS